MNFVFGLILLLISAFAHAQQTWLVIGDSIMSSVPGGSAQQAAPFLIQASRNVYIRNLSSPGAALGAKDATGYNSQQFISELSRIGGMFSAYDGIIIQAGTNDYGRGIPWQDTVSALRLIMSHAKGMNKKVLLLDPIWRAGEEQKNSLGHALNAYRYFMALVCVNEYKGTCHYAPRANTVMGSASGASFYASSEVSTGTQLHPNAAGQSHLAQWIISEAAAAGFF